ncbi:MAG: transcriptional repressor [Candidatus Gracilibacteria bacterium]|nr:transcriptional repressor [Candidatus Gracilibacteria bacterium]
MKTHFYTQYIVEICDNKHLTVVEIFEILLQKYPNAGKSSVYRNVDELALNGSLKKVVGAGKKTYFEKAKQNHIHLIDENSGKIIDLEIDEIPDFNLPTGFKANNFDVKIFGKFS